MKLALTLKESLLFKHLSVRGNLRPVFRQALGIDYELPEMLYRDGEMYWNYDDDTKFNRSLLTKRSLNQAIGHFIRRMEKAAVKLETTSRQIAALKIWPPRDEETTAALLEQYVGAYLLSMPFLYSFWNVENLLIKQLHTDLKIIFGNDKAPDVMTAVLIPARATYFAREQKSLAKLKQFRRSRKLEALLKQHLAEFGFTTTAVLLGKPLTASGVLKRTAQLKPGKIKERARQSARDKRTAAQMLNKLSPYPDIYQRVKLAQELMFWKNQRLDVMWKSDFQVRPLLRAAAKMLKIKYDELIYLTYEEIESSLETGKRQFGRREMKKRQKAYALHLKAGKITVVSNPREFPQAPAMLHEQETTDVAGGEILKGQTVYPGKISGPARLVLETKDIKKVQKGDVLITMMTRPEMMIGLEKAAAFVTDQGGILSHAAIVSRELKKPCVIGTKIATKVFKDGDLVEVDANQGVVRKI